MLPTSIHIYTDASFSKTYKLAVIGYVRFESKREHETLAISEVRLNIRPIKENNNIRAELRGAIEALRVCPKGATALLFTDCQTVTNLLARRERLERTGYISQSKKLVLANADLYREFYLIFDRIKLELVWVKGHSPNENKGKIQKNFSYLDKEVRKIMREVIGNRF